MGKRKPVGRTDGRSAWYWYVRTTSASGDAFAVHRNGYSDCITGNDHENALVHFQHIRNKAISRVVAEQIETNPLNATGKIKIRD